MGNKPGVRGPPLRGSSSCDLLPKEPRPSSARRRGSPYSAPPRIPHPLPLPHPPRGAPAPPRQVLPPPPLASACPAAAVTRASWAASIEPLPVACIPRPRTAGCVRQGRIGIRVAVRPSSPPRGPLTARMQTRFRRRATLGPLRSRPAPSSKAGPQVPGGPAPYSVPREDALLGGPKTRHAGGQARVRGGD